MSQIKIGPGLNNLGNTCFFNAVMQSVLHTKRLSNYFLGKNHSQNCQKNQWCVFCQMQKTYHLTRNNKSFSPHGMINNLKKIFKKFKLGRQQDSHQFLRYLIEGMQQCQTGKLGKQRQKNEQKIKKTKIFNIFGGIIKNVVLCLNCKHKSITTQRYYDLNIQCQKSNTLDEGLQRFFATDQLKGKNKYLCQNCKNRVDATKRFYLQSTPHTFTFQMKRFTNMLRKIGKFIKYPKYINLGKYYDHQRKTILRLSSVIVHSGYSADSGHYYAYVRTGEDWYRMDDSYVTKCSQQQAMAQNAYVLLYQKIKDQVMNKQTQNTNKQKSKQKVQPISEQNKQTIIQNKSKENQLKIKENQLKNNQLKKQQLKKAQLFKNVMKQQKSQKGTAETINTTNISQNLNQKQNNQNNQSKDKKKIVQSINNKKQQRQMNDELENGSEDQGLFDVPLPILGARKKSKQQAQQNMSLQQILFKSALKISQLHTKLPPPGRNGYRNLRPVYNLRKYQIIMKKRKLEN